MVSFSVVIPTRNRHHFLRQAIGSVLSQSIEVEGIIVVDDGEGASQAVQTLSQNIIVLDNRQRGPVSARNLGVAHSQSECIAFLDDDDWWTDVGYLERAAGRFEEGSSFCFADGAMMFEDGRPPLGYSHAADVRSLETDNTILISAVTYRRSLHAQLGVFDETLPFYWDWDWYLRVARAGHSLVHLADPVVAIRVHGQNMSGESLEAQRRANLDRFATKHGLPPIPLKNHLDIATGAPGSLP